MNIKDALTSIVNEKANVREDAKDILNCAVNIHNNAESIYKLTMGNFNTLTQVMETFKHIRKFSEHIMNETGPMKI